MARWAAFLRGINLGKSRRVKNEQLRDAFEQAGFAGVATYRASGNVILDAAEELDDSEVEARAEAALAEALGFEVTVFVRSATELASIAAREPSRRGSWPRPRAGSRSRCCRGSRRPPRGATRSPWRATPTASRSRAGSSTGCRATG